MNLYTGTAQVNVPLFTLPSVELKIPVSLDYVNGNGVKVQDVANFVGLGWRLNAGGNISRVVRGRPDETDSGYIGKNLYGQALNTSGATAGQIYNIGNGIQDGEPDLFTVTTPFFSFRFVLDQFGNPVFSNNPGIRITHNLYNNANYRAGTSWVVTDADGNQFYFGSSSASRENQTTNLGANSVTFPSTWYLDKIVTFNSKDVINFTYTTGPDYTVTHYQTYEVACSASGGCYQNGCTNISPTADNIVTTYNSPKYISQITSSIGEIDFNYVFDRRDFANDGRLTSMTVYTYDPTAANKVLNRSFQFNYSYFGDPSTNPDALRLRLDDINLYGRGSTGAPQKYKAFDYNLSSNLPARNSVEFDYWGYYNTNSSGTTLVPAANKAPDPVRVQANILTAVHDLSGEALKLYYEPNIGVNLSTLFIAPGGGVRTYQVSKVSPSGESLDTKYAYVDANNSFSGQLNNTDYINFTKIVTYICYQYTFTMSESQYDIYDLNGNFVGYSYVKVTYPNGGYEMNNFTNFKDFPDVFQFSNVSPAGYTSYSSQARQLSAATSYSYKRGLLVDKAVYTAGGKEISDIHNTYGSLDPLTQKALSIVSIPVFFGLFGSESFDFGLYYANVENYLLTQTKQISFDQNDQTLTNVVTTNYTYAANHRLVQRIDYADSKGLARNKIYYYTEDANAPYTTGDEQYAINSMLQANRLNAIVHSVETNNTTSINTHYSYLSFRDINLNTKVYLGGKKIFINNSPNSESEVYQYDLNSSCITGVSKSGGPFLSTQYGYQNTCMTAKVRNALNTTSVSLSNGTWNGQLLVLPGYTNPVNSTFVVDYTGTISLNLAFPTGVTGVNAVNVSYTITGPSTAGGTFCISTNNSCSSNSTATLTNMPPGTYELNVQPISTTGNWPGFFNWTYPQVIRNYAYTNEFFYEGFEYGGNGSQTPFAGERYYVGPYTVPFIMPNTRTYQIDYHYLLNGVWYAKTRPYQNNMVLSDGSAVDEVRVYPSDAQMNTYTYDALNGVTSECDARNRCTFYEYDDFGRLKDTRDNDGNILHAYDYQYQAGMGQTCLLPVISSIATSGSNFIVTSTASAGSTSCIFAITDQTSGFVYYNTLGCNSSVTLPIPARPRSYTVTVTSISPDCPGGVQSNPQAITVP